MKSSAYLLVPKVCPFGLRMLLLMVKWSQIRPSPYVQSFALEVKMRVLLYFAFHKYLELTKTVHSNVQVCMVGDPPTL